MTPHGHTWYATLHLRSLTSLNQDNMVVEFSKVKSFWKNFISDVMDHSYLCNSQDQLISAILDSHKEARLLRFPGDPTTEMISLLLFSKAELVLKDSGLGTHIHVAGVTIDETPTNSIFCSREYYQETMPRFKHYTGWWTTPALEDRSFSHVDTPTN